MNPQHLSEQELANHCRFIADRLDHYPDAAKLNMAKDCLNVAACTIEQLLTEQPDPEFEFDPDLNDDAEDQSLEVLRLEGEVGELEEERDQLQARVEELEAAAKASPWKLVGDARPPAGITIMVRRNGAVVLWMADEYPAILPGSEWMAIPP